MDDVLSETNLAVLDYIHNHSLNINLTYDTRKRYYLGQNDWIDMKAEDSTELYHKVFEEDVEIIMPKVKWSKKALKKLKKKWHHLHLITARDVWSKEYSKKWIDKYFPDIFDSITFIEEENFPTHSKWDVCKALKIDYMIDDCLDYVRDVSRVWIKSFLLSRPWNKYEKIWDKNIKRVSKWKKIKIG